MRTLHPTLLIGPYDWGDDGVPREEFAARARALFAALPKAEALIVYGDTRRHAELAYLAHYAPKLEPALAFIARSGEAVLLPSEAPAMWGAAKRQSWIAEMMTLKNVREIFADKSDLAAVMLNGDAMPPALHTMIAAIFSDAADETRILRAQMAAKSAAERACLAEGVRILGQFGERLQEARRTGASDVSALLAAEEAALAGGAQDVRVLFSRDGGRTLRPFSGIDSRRSETLLAYAAIRAGLYWVEGFFTLGSSPAHAVLNPALEAMVGAAGSGARAADLVQAAQARLSGAPHPIVARQAILPLGLELDEPTPETLDPDGIYSLRLGTGGDAPVLLSAIVAPGAVQPILWRSP